MAVDRHGEQRRHMLTNGQVLLGNIQGMRNATIMTVGAETNPACISRILLFRHSPGMIRTISDGGNGRSAVFTGKRVRSGYVAAEAYCKYQKKDNHAHGHNLSQSRH